MKSQFIKEFMRFTMSMTKNIKKPPKIKKIIKQETKKCISK